MEPRELIHHIEETRTSAKEYTGGFEITGGSRQEGLLYVSSWAGTKLERCYQIRTSEQLEARARGPLVRVQLGGHEA